MVDINNSLTIGTNFASQPIEKKLPPEKIAEVKKPESLVSTEVTPKEQSNLTANVGKSNSTFSFVESTPQENHSNNTTSKEALAQINTQLQALTKNKGLPEQEVKVLSARLTNLSNTIQKSDLSKPEEINKIGQELNNTVIALKTAGIKTEVLNPSLNQLMTSLTNEVASKNKLNLALVANDSNIMGLKVNQAKLTPEQDKAVGALKNTAMSLEQLKVQEPKKMTNSDLILMSVRDELLRMSFDRLNMRAEKPLEKPIETDLKIINNMVASVDKMLASTRNIPNNMLADLSNMTKALSSAPMGELDKSLKTLSDSLAKPINAGAIKDAPNMSMLKDLNKQLIGLTENTPSGVASGVNTIIQGYSKAMNTVEKSLPPILPFPVTIPIPLGYDNGSGNKFLLAPGSKISQTGTGFQISAPAMLMENGSTQVSAGNTQIQLGNGVDYLSMGSLKTNTGSTQADLTNATAKIDRKTGTSVIKADKAVVNMTDGKVELTNTGLYQNADGSLKLASDSLWYEKGDTHAGMKNFQALQSEKDGVANLNVSANNLDLKKADTVVTADKFTFDMTKNANDNTSQALMGAENVRFFKDGNEIIAKKADIQIIKNSDGSSLMQVTAENPTVNLANGKKIKVNGNSLLKIEQSADGNIKAITVSAQNINYQDKTSQVNVTNGDLKVNYNDDGTLGNLQTKADKVAFTNKDNNIVAEKANVNLAFENNKLTTLTGSVDKLSNTSSQGKLDVTKGTINANFDKDGNLEKLTGGADSLSYLSDKGDKLDVKGFGIEVNAGKNGIESATATAGQINYLSNKGDLLNVTNGKASLTRDAQGNIANLSGSAEKIAFGNQKGDNIIASGTEINVNCDKNGLKDAQVKVGTLDYNNLKGDKLNLVNGSATITRDNKGLISTINGSAEQLNGLDKNGNTLAVNGLKVGLVSTGQDSYNLNASADKLNLALPKQELNINANNLRVGLTDTQMTMHVDSAEIIKKVEADLKVKVENLDVIVDKTKEGTLKSLDAQLSTLDASIKGMNMMVRTENGDRVRLNMSLSEDGKMLKEAFLQIPKGGEVKIEKGDLKVNLGEQLIKFSQNDGIYTLRDDGLNIAAQFKGGKVQVAGGSAQVSLDTKSGNLIIDEIKGTKINAEFGKNKLDVDIKEITGFMIKTTGLSGPVNGLSMELVPTKDSSKMTMSLRADIGGIPVKVDLKDVHHLKASAELGINRAHVYFGDVSGRGKVSVGVGPLEMKGSAIEFLAKYNTYSPERMMSSVSRYMSNDGLQLGSLTLEADGVVRLEKQSSGLHLGASLILPRTWEKAYELVGVPSNVAQKDGTWGAIASIGGQGRSGDGTKYMGALYTGLVPGSYLSIKQTQGTTSIYNVPLPSNMEIPTTVIGGLMFRRENDSSKLGATVGGYLNPVGLVPKDSSIPLRDQTMYGGFAGVNYRTKDLQFSLDALVDVNKDANTGKTVVDPGFRAGMSLSF